MYKALLCMRYLRSRYIALASIISVMLGVATMIVVNSVMSGFTTEMRDRIHGILSDVTVQYNSLSGDEDPEALIEQIRKVVGDDIYALTPTVDIPGMFMSKHYGEYRTQPVMLIGIDPKTKSQVGPWKEYLQSFQETEVDGKKVPPQRSMSEAAGFTLTKEAKAYRKRWIDQNASFQHYHAMNHDHEQVNPIKLKNPIQTVEGIKSEKSKVTTADSVETDSDVPNFEEDDPIEDSIPDSHLFDDLDKNKPVEAADPYELRDIQIIPGAGLTQYFIPDEKTGKLELVEIIKAGDDANIATPNSALPPELKSAAVSLVDIFKSGMSEYDSKLVFVNLKGLQKLRGMLLSTAADDEKGAITSVQIKLKDGADSDKVVAKLKAALPPVFYSVRTWEDQQMPLLSAVDIETTILNILLFLIIAVAGFGILAIFFMIVVEKTRDIGILKSLGASSNGVMSIFLAYGLALGVVGSGVGVVMGLLFVKYINVIEGWLTWVTGRKVFDERIYYFPEIPTSVSASMVIWVAVGAITISVLASILPARRASRLHPVQALRYE